MKKIIKKVLKPKKAFEQWALENDIKLSKRLLKPNKKTLLRWISAAAVAFAVCMAFIFPILSGYPLADTEPKYYMENETFSAKVDGTEDFKALGEFFKLKNILFFDFNRVLNPELALYENIAKDNETLILSYYVENCIVSFKGDNSRGFSVNFRVLTYKNYRFADHPYYSNLSSRFEYNLTIQYRIDDFSGTKIAFVKFSYGAYEYFLKIQDIGAGDLTDENLQIFLSDLFK